MSGIDGALQACLEDLESGSTSVDETLERHVEEATAREELRALIAVAQRYRRAPDAQPSSEFRQSARARMLGLIAAEVPSRRRSSAWPPRLTWVGIRPATLARIAAATVALLLVVVGGGTAALVLPPSSPLFGARLALEEARMLVTPGAGQRLELRMAAADRRAAELEAMVGSTGVWDVDLAAERYQSALRGEVEESSAAADWEITLLDQRLAHQEEVLQRAAEVMGARSVDEALSAVARERDRLRERRGQDSPGSPPASGDGQPGQGYPRDGAPAPEYGATPEPAATATASAPGASDLDPDRPPAGNAATPGPSTSSSSDTGQERNHQQGEPPQSPPPAPSATATPQPAKPGGSGGTAAPTPGPRPSGPRSGQGGPSGSQAGPSGGRPVPR